MVSKESTIQIPYPLPRNLYVVLFRSRLWEADSDDPEVYVKNPFKFPFPPARGEKLYLLSSLTKCFFELYHRVYQVYRLIYSLVLSNVYSTVFMNAG